MNSKKTHEKHEKTQNNTFVIFVGSKWLPKA